MKILILAAGYATRLYPLTKHWPKPLLMVKEKPIIWHIISNVRFLEGLKEIIIVTNDKFSLNFQKWSSGVDFGVPITIINDETTSEKNRLGAIGDIDFVLKNHPVEEDLLVIGGDNLFSFNLGSFLKYAKEKNNSCTIGLHELNDPENISRYGVVSIDSKGKLISFEEKPKNSTSRLISMCIYYFPKKTIGFIPEYLSQDHSSDATGSYIRWLHEKIDVWGYVLKGVWYDIGDIDTFYHTSVTYDDTWEKVVKLD
ncbi:MAG: nucleotidyltransferase family protein [Candidatus Omnitrophota bacterium]